jgi:hypothetical protein
MIKHLLVMLLLAISTTFAYSLGTIEGIVWLDDNADGIKDFSEVGINAVSVSLIDDATGLQVGANQSTNFAGAYSFANLPAGSYYVRFNTPFPNGSHRVSPLNQGGDDTVDSDASTTAPHVTSGEVKVITANEIFDDVFMGLYLSADINGVVWEDVNGNGQRNGGDGNCPQNVDVTLIDATTGVNVTTNASGGALINPVNTNNTYQFLDLPPGDYIVEFSEPGGVYPTGLHLTLQKVGAIATDSDADRSSGQSDVISLNGVDINNIDAGYFLVGQVGDFVWEDLNGDGQQGAEPGLGGIAVELIFAAGGTALDVDGNPIPVQNTTGAGAYLFDEVPPGIYKVKFEVNPTAASGNTLYFTLQNTGADGTDSDANKVTGESDPTFTIMSGDPENIDVDAGYIQKCTVGDFTWHDLNGNGINDSEPGIDVAITITKITPAGPFNQVDGTTAYVPGLTSSGGNYLYDNLPPGEYKLTFTAPVNYFITLQNAGSGTDDSDPDRLMGMTAAFTCESGEVKEDIDAGFFTKCTIGDFVWHDEDGDGNQGAEPGLGGMLVEIIDVATGLPVAFRANGTPYPGGATITTTGTGIYNFNDLPPGEYKLIFSDPSATYKLTQLDATGDDKDNDADIAMGGMTRDYTCESDEVIDHIDAGFFTKATLKGTAWHDSDGDGIKGGSEPFLANVVFTLTNTVGPTLDIDGNPVLPETSNASGDYTFNNLRPGIYTMTAALGGWLFTIPLATGGPNDSEFDAGGNLINDVTLLSNGVKTDINAGLYKLITLKGTVWAEDDLNSLNGAPPANQSIANVAIELCKSVGGVVDATTTNAMGEYTFMDVIPGDYIVKVVSSNFGTSMPLYGLETCDGQTGDNDVNDDDNGDGPVLGPVITQIIKLYCGQEPEGPEMTENSTVDFCFKSDCGAINPLAAPECIQADTICDLALLEVFCSRMPQEQGQLVGTPVCPGAAGTSFHNTSWFAFVAGNGTYDMVFDIFGCVGGGAQAGVYEDCTLATAVACQPGCFTGNFTVSSSVLIPGKVYFFFLDGCNGSVCSYKVDIIGDFQQYQIPEIVDIVYTSPCKPDTICPNTTVDFEVTDAYKDLSAKFTWKITDPSNISTTIVTEEELLTYTFGNKVGKYKVEVVSIDAKCSLPIDPFFIEITVANPPDEDWGVWPVCENDLGVGWEPVTVFGTSETNPNGDCEIGWFGGTMPLPVVNTKTLTKTITQDGCTFKQTVTVVKKFNSKPVKLDTFLCPGEILEVGQFKIKTNTENFELTLVNEAGCDSNVIVNLAYLGVDGFIEDLGCTNGIYSIQFVLNGTAPNPFPAYPDSLSYVWYNAAGMVITDGDPDNNPKTMTVNSSGMYSVTVTHKAKNTYCSFPIQPIDLNLGNLVPPMLTFTSPWSVNLCKNNAVATYSVSSTEPAANIKEYVWTIPPGAVFVGKKDSSVVTVDWSNSTGGKICASIRGECGISPPLCDSVIVTPIPVVSLGAIADVCKDNQITITALITDKPTYTYNWNFDGGNALSSTGPGPHTVSWGDKGVKNISVTVSENNCVSLPATTKVNVFESEPAPIVICDGVLGEITFTWPAVIGATNYGVNVITGQTGVLSGNAATGFTYKITGLGLQEFAKIILTTNTNSPCGALTSSSECETQDCKPPSVILDAVPDICITASTTSINLNAVISPVSSQGGTYLYSGNGIIDAANGIFDPNQALKGANTITLKYIAPDLCVKNASVVINVYETPTADFKSTDLIICQDSSVVIDYIGNVLTGGSYDWKFGDVVSPGSGQGPFTLEWNSPGVKNLELTVEKDGCKSSTFPLKVTVEPRIEQVKISCTDQQPTEISVGWNAISNTNNYTLFVNGVAQPNTNGLTFTSSNLVPGSSHFYEVIANSKNACPGTKDSITCIAVNCPPIAITFSAKDTTICLNSDAKPFKINSVITGGLGGNTGVSTWSGKGIDADGNFDPISAGPSTGVGHKITLNFVDGTCKATKSINIRVLAQPKSTFTMPDKICIDDDLNITFTGTSSVPLDWKTPANVTISPNGVSNFKTKFSAPGTYKLGLVVGNAICLSDLVERSVVVEPKLEVIDINCTTTLNSIDFTWDDIECAKDYEIVIDGVNKGKQSNLNYLISNLAEGTKITIEILPISECLCPAVKVSKQCEAKACPTITLALSTPKDKFCEGDLAAAFQLVANVTGSSGTGIGKWKGDNVNESGLFDPKNLKAGVYTAKYEFIEENCTFVKSIDVTIVGKPTLSTLTTSPDCYLENNGTAIQTTTGGDGNYTYRLDGNAITLADLGKIAPGTHILVVNDGNGCNASTSFTITPAPSGEITVDGLPEILKGQITSFTASIKSIPGKLDSIVWKNSAGEILCSGPNCLTISNLKPLIDDTYCARAFYNSGCYIEDCFTQVVRPLIEIILPNIIKVGEGENSGFFIQSFSNIEVVNSMNIYDRWGNLVFTKQNFKPGPDQSATWDGKLQGKDIVPGVYVYTIDLIKVGGKREVFNGDVTVVK